MSENVTLDRIDVAIVRSLQLDGRVTNKDLAATVGLSQSACLERVRRLTEAGVVVGFTAVVDPASVGIGLEAILMVRLQRHTRTVIDAFQTHCHELDEVISLWHLTGTSDYLVRVVARDHAHLRDFLMDSFTTRPEVAQLQTHIVLWSDHKPAWPVWP